MCLNLRRPPPNAQWSAFRENLADHLAYADNSCLFQKQRQLHGAIATMPRAYCSSQDAIALSRDFGYIGFAGARSRSIAPLTPNCMFPDVRVVSASLLRS